MLGHVADALLDLKRFFGRAEAGDLDLPFRRPEKAEQKAEKGGFSGPVGADQSGQSAGFYLQVKAADGERLLEFFDQPMRLDRQHLLHRDLHIHGHAGLELAGRIVEIRFHHIDELQPLLFRLDVAGGELRLARNEIDLPLENFRRERIAGHGDLRAQDDAPDISLGQVSLDVCLAQIDETEQDRAGDGQLAQLDMLDLDITRDRRPYLGVLEEPLEISAAGS